MVKKSLPSLKFIEICIITQKNLRFFYSKLHIMMSSKFLLALEIILVPYICQKCLLRGLASLKIPSTPEFEIHHTHTHTYSLSQIGRSNSARKSTATTISRRFEPICLIAFCLRRLAVTSQFAASFHWHSFTFDNCFF